MVATLVKLRLLLLRNGFRRSTAQLVAVIIGALYGLLVMVLAIAGLVGLNFVPTELTRTIVVLGGAALTLGWAVLPLFLATEQTLDPPHLAVYPIPQRTLLIGLLVSGVVAIPGGITMIASFFTFASWLRLPGVAVIAAVCGVAGAALCIMLSRAVTSVAAGLTSGRRFREAAGVLIVLPIFLIGPIIVGVAASLSQARDALPTLADVLSWTPLGAIWAVPSQVALGDPWGAVLRALIGAATLVVVFAVWKWGLARSLSTPVRATSRVRASGHLGWFGRVPATPAGAVAARCLTYWFRDPRYLRQLMIIPVFPLIMWFEAMVLSDSDTGAHNTAMLLIAPPLVAFFLSVALIADVSYDSTAFVLHMTTSLPGRADRWGRVSAVLMFGMPVVIALAVGMGAASGHWRLVPALLGLSIGMLLGGLAITAVTSATVVFPAPRPGDSPFKSRPGATSALLGSTFLVWGVLAVIAAPEIVLLIISAVTHDTLWGWIGLAVGVVLGSVLLWLGVRSGGRILDRRAPELLLQLQANA